MRRPLLLAVPLVFAAAAAAYVLAPHTPAAPAALAPVPPPLDLPAAMAMPPAALPATEHLTAAMPGVDPWTATAR